MLDVWASRLRSELIEPTLELAASLPSTPRVVLRTAPPNKWGDEAQLDIAALNNAARRVARKYPRLELLDWARTLEYRGHLVYDMHHYSTEFELQRLNVLLNAWRWGEPRASSSLSSI